MSQYKVLLVDDEELALIGMEKGIDWMGLLVERVYKADSMKSAMKVIQRESIDLMVSDIEMPGGSGLELIRWVREKYPEVVCIFYTCHADFAFCQEAIRLGAVDYVLKPIPYEELEIIIQKGLFSVKKNKEAKNLEERWGNFVQEPEGDSPVEIVKRIISENITVEISRDELARKVFMSPDYLTKLFKRETGMALNEYIIQKRLSLAKNLLLTTNLSIVEISQKTGFSYSSYFVRIFKKKVEMTPQQFREKYKQDFSC